MSLMDDQTVRVFMTGTFRIETLGGEDITPNATKAQALLALLCTSKTGMRSRSWLKSKLWSDRGPNQAAGSLRQCLAQTRNTLRHVPGLLQATRQNVTINLAQIELIAEQGEDYLEGLDVRDEAFEDWLRILRNANDQAVVQTEPKLITPAQLKHVPRALCIQFSTSGENNTDQASWLGKLLSDDLARNLRESFSIDVSVVQGGQAGPSHWTAGVETCLLSASTVGVRMSLSRSSDGVHIWAGSKTVDMQGAPPTDHPEVVLLSNTLIEAFGDALFQDAELDETCPDRLCREAIKSMFSLRPEDVSRADAMFAKAYDLQPRGLYLAWRAQAKTIMKIERFNQDVQGLQEEAEAFCAKALEIEPNNSMVLATVANTYCQFFRSFEKGTFLAGRSVLLNPSNPMAWFSLSATSMYAGNEKEALKYALWSNRLALTSPHRFWWDSQVFGAALMSGKLAEAQHFAEMCRTQNPNFRPPLRYLIGLYANAGREEDAMKMATELTALEPDFSIERLIKDQSYPASVLHKDIGIDLNKVAALG